MKPTQPRPHFSPPIQPLYSELPSTVSDQARRVAADAIARMDNGDPGNMDRGLMSSGVQDIRRVIEREFALREDDHYGRSLAQLIAANIWEIEILHAAVLRQADSIRSGGANATEATFAIIPRLERIQKIQLQALRATKLLGSRLWVHAPFIRRRVVRQDYREREPYLTAGLIEDVERQPEE